MSVRTIEHRSKKQYSHSPSRKTKNPSYFPRHVVNKFEGEHLGMKVRLTTKSGLQNRRNNYAYIPSARVEDIIIKFIGLPYTDMCKEITRKFKECKTNFAFDIDQELGHFFDVGRFRWHGPSYGIDKNGNVFKLKPLKNKGLHLSPSQIKWNKSQKIPNWGSVCKPYVLRDQGFSFAKGPYNYNSGSPSEKVNIGEFYQPKLIGEYWCIVHKNIVKLPVYHVPQGQDYLNWAMDRSEYKWNPDFKVYTMVKPLPKYSDKWKPGQGRHEAEIFESMWSVPHIYMSKKTISPFFHTCKVEGANPKYESLVQDIRRLEGQLAIEKLQGNISTWCLDSLNSCKEDLKVTPKTCILETGYGQLYPLVKESDYQKYMGL